MLHLTSPEGYCLKYKSLVRQKSEGTRKEGTVCERPQAGSEMFPIRNYVLLIACHCGDPGFDTEDPKLPSLSSGEEKSLTTGENARFDVDLPDSKCFGVTLGLFTDDPSEEDFLVPIHI
ncbi:hypothetical protein TNIN_9331 [Trichonephila inaurata madagascariensis]|uniref:Uncharacterized protein n=1 Tax=Trichonephila inaurata madagascariensis TaxID=2747483 RepID=A0A8X6YYK2_9ARAC|nr:hypothetical protein TNIN_9331 [Trichonephila inaurata madagascariensis]